MERSQGVSGREEEGRDAKRSGPGADRKKAGRRLEIVVTTLSALLLLAASALLVWEGTRPYRPARFESRVEQVRVVDGRHYLRITVENSGRESVQGLGVRLELKSGDEVVDSASAVLDWLPEGSSRSVVLILEHDPALYEQVFRFEGYQVP